MTIYLFKPCMGKEEMEAVNKVIESGWIGLGPITAEFEKKFSEYIGVPHSVGLNSATAALDMSMKILNIRHGDEVLVPTMTFVSTAHAVAYNLAYPKFVDIDPVTLDIDLEDLQRKITSRTKAIIVVHYGGRPVNMDKVMEIAKAKKLNVVEDAAHACGASYKGRKVGSLGDIGCFSFHAVKNLATGDGGMITLKDKDLANRSKKLRWLGIDKGTWDRSKLDRSYWWEYFVDEIGLKNHMHDMAAAMGLVQLKKLDSMNGRRKEIAEMYTKAFKSVPAIETPVMDDKDCQSSWHIYHIKYDKRDELSRHLDASGIQTGVHYKPIHLYSCYGNTPSLPVAEKVFKRILSLPMHPNLTNSDVEMIIDKTIEFAKKN